MRPVSNGMSKKAAEQKHTTLYRAYRPQSFKESSGQEHIVAVLEAAIAKGTIAHAYLFTGSRGIGKTTFARIFAREIGCTEKDLYELDAASNNSVENIRELREGVYAMPFESPYKVYIVDEVHMLSQSAFNAFLKILEEPPAHVIFILATTELNKVPETVRSRCEIHHFKQPTRAILSERVAEVAKAEGYTLESAGAELVALLAEGSFRDALGLLQKVLTVASGKKVTLADVETVSGAPSNKLVSDIFEALVVRDTTTALSAVDIAVEANIDMKTLLKLLMERVRGALLLRVAPDMKVQLAELFSEEVFARLVAVAQEPALTSDTLRALLAAYDEMAYAALPRIPLELAIVELTAKPAAQ